MRLRAHGVAGVFNRFAVAFHYKPRPTAADVPGMVRQARAQARTAVQLRALHDHWRVVLAIGDDPLRRGFHRVARRFGALARLERAVGAQTGDVPLAAPNLVAARALAREAYYAELESARRS
jgi:hypothetical protein